MLDYEKALNSAQLEAATSPAGSTLVVAGAGSGKTRVIVYRLAWLLEHGVDPSAILLLTFTRKAAHEMMARAEHLLERNVDGLAGGTFHSFAFGVLRRFHPDWLEGRPFTLMDSADINQAVRHCREEVLKGKKDTSFPKTQTIAGILSKARNKEVPVAEIIRRDCFHLLPHADQIEEIGAAYAAWRREKGLMDYDDLLFGLEDLLAKNGPAAAAIRSRYRHILVDEYQDTNLVQARIVRLLAAPPPGCDDRAEPWASVMAVGDEAQSIYAFRGANVRNIMDFPKIFPDTRVIRLEENYRSTQPILDVANNILANAAESFNKNLYTNREGGEKPALVIPLSDGTEAKIVAARIEELLATHQPHEIAVLFRSGYHSYQLENLLRQAGIRFRKYGGLRFVEAAHVKDLLAFARLALNPLDILAFSRIAAMHKGIGPKTIARLYEALRSGDPKKVGKAFAKYRDLNADLDFIDSLRREDPAPLAFFERVLEYYRFRLENLYPEDWPSRLPGLEEILQISSSYSNLELLVADLSLDTTDEEESAREDEITLSTIHSAKGLEWKAVLLLDLVEDRFPSRHAQANEEDFEEERRLFYVACTRAKRALEIYAPVSVFSRTVHANEPASQSPFLRELNPKLFRRLRENYGGALESGALTDSGSPDLSGLAPRPAPNRLSPRDLPEMALQDEARCPCGMNRAESPLAPGYVGAYCRHKIFGRGKIVEWPGDNKAKVDFPGYGVKTIIADYLFPEE